MSRPVETPESLRDALLPSARQHHEKGGSYSEFIDRMVVQIGKLVAQDKLMNCPPAGIDRRCRAAFEGVALTVTQVWGVRCAVAQKEIPDGKGGRFAAFTIEVL